MKLEEHSLQLYRRVRFAGRLSFREKIPACPENRAASGGAVYAGVSGADLRREYADRGVLVLSVYRGV